MSQDAIRAHSSPDAGAQDGFVFDSYAILALLEDEDGADEVAYPLAAPPGRLVLMTCVNLGEILYTVMRERGQEQADAALLALESTPLLFIPAERTLTLTAARLKARHRISYANAFCAALSVISGYPLVTGDPEFRDLEGTVRVHWIGPEQN